MIQTQVAERIATLTFHRPEKLNALGQQLISDSIATLRAWSLDPAVGVIIVTGSGRAFCAGGDVSAMVKDTGRSLEESIDGLRSWQELSWLLYSIPKVTIAAVNGFAMGAGLGVCLACDLRIASDQAKFGTAYAKVGYGGDFGTTWLLTQYAGAPKAKELMFLGDMIDAAEAHRLGGVDHVAQEHQLLRFRRAGVLREQPGGAEVAAITDLGVGRSELRLIGSDAQIAGETDAKARAHGESVDGGDGHFRNVVEEPGELLPIAEAVDAFFQRAVGTVGHVGNVAAGAEGAADSGDDDDADIRVGAPLAQGAGGFIEQL